MKTTINLLQQLSRREIYNLTVEVKEIIAELTEKTHKPFSPADLWNIQRRRKSTSIRRYYSC